MEAGQPASIFAYLIKKELYSIRGMKKMIEVTKLNGLKTLINPELIETVESNPDTVISFTTGRKIIVKESRQEVNNLVKSYRKELFAIK